MGALIFGRTQIAVGTPFTPNRVSDIFPSASPFTSIETQRAIEECLQLAISNDRYLVLGNYGGNANVGRYLEWWPAQGSDVSPLFNSAVSKVLDVVVQTASVSATCNIGIFDLNVSSVTPIYTIVMNGVKRVQYTGTPLLPLAVASGNSLLAARVTSGSINSPTIQLIFSSAT